LFEDFTVRHFWFKLNFVQACLELIWDFLLLSD